MNVRQVLQPAMKSLPQQLWNIRYVPYLATKMKGCKSFKSYQTKEYKFQC
jgi:hypothetical protein